MKMKTIIPAALFIVITIIVSYLWAFPPLQSPKLISSLVACPPPPGDTCKAKGIIRVMHTCSCDKACNCWDDYRVSLLITYCTGDCVNWWKFCTEGSFEDVSHWTREKCVSYIDEEGYCLIRFEDPVEYTEEGHTILSCYCERWI
jgi:hypothetical protein